MSKVQVDTIVDKDDISAPTFSKGAIVTGVCTATTFVGAVTGDVTGDVTGNADTATSATSATSATTATTATNAQGLTGTPNISCGTIAGSTGTFTGDVDIADKIVHTGDTDTAIRFPDSNIFSVETGGTERLRVIADGKVGIGTTIPTRSFDVRGDATIGIDQHSGNPGTTVGILTVRGHHVNSDAEYAQLYLANSNSSGGATASIRGNRDATSNNATSLSFFTNHTSSAGNGDERLRIGTNGQLGLSAGGVGVAATDYGTSGQVLTSGGASATATWADASGGAWELVTSGLVDSGGEYEVIGSTSTLTSSYQMYRLTFYTEQTPSSGQSGLQLEIYNGAWRYDTNYAYGWIQNGGSIDNQTSAKGILLGKMGRRFEGVVQFSNPSQTTRPKWFSARVASMNSDTGWSEPINHQVSGQYIGSTKNDAVTGIRLRSIDSSPAGGESAGENFSAGYYLLEGCAIS